MGGKTDKYCASDEHGRTHTRYCRLLSLCTKYGCSDVNELNSQTSLNSKSKQNPKRRGNNETNAIGTFFFCLRIYITHIKMNETNKTNKVARDAEKKGAEK